MMTVRAMVMTAPLVLGLALAAAAAEPKAAKSDKPVVSCKQIVETYKTSQSVDETADALLVDQSVVVACLKAAGVAVPTEDDR